MGVRQHTSSGEGGGKEGDLVEQEDHGADVQPWTVEHEEKILTEENIGYLMMGISVANQPRLIGRRDWVIREELRW